MESVNYEYFDSENDYSKNPNATKHRFYAMKLACACIVIIILLMLVSM